MADALVSVVLDQLASITRQQIEQEVQLVVRVGKEVQKLTSNFQAIQAVLDDAEKRQVKESTVRGWLDKLKDTSYDIDDVLDEWSTAILKHQLEGVNNAPAPKKICSFISSPCYCFGQVFVRRDSAIKIKVLNERLDVIAKERETYHFKLKRSSEEPEHLKTTSFIDVSEVQGRTSDKNTIIDRLLCESSQEEKGLQIISIVGLGGIGKTTLAQLAYNDDDVKAHFEKKIWVCVSDPFNEVRIAKAIIEELQGASPNLTELNPLHKHIHDSVVGKKFLLVLDDVWTEDNSMWEPLKLSLKSGAKGSKVLVTTRNERVARMMGTTYTHHLGELSKDDCWSLFSHIAFFERSSEDREKLEEIGRKLVDKCKGLPLAAKTLGSLMRLKDSKEEWQIVLDSEVWKLEVVENHLSAPLLLSYYDLSPAMKRCFSYCAVFPKDTVMRRDDLVLLWMAQGYLNSEKNAEMEITGREYFKNLAMRSFFQDFGRDEDDGNIIDCKMHDIVHDFAQFLMKNECIIIEDDDVRELGRDSSSIRARHASLTIRSSLSSFIYNIKNLRTLNSLPHFSKIDSSLTDLCKNLTCLRALDMSRCSVKEIPSEVRKLIHLRYFNLSCNGDLTELPETVCELCNLQTMTLNSCWSLERLPQGIGKLINLRHLEFFWTNLKTLPKGIGRLSSLRTLTKFNVCGGGDDCKIEDLKSLNHLRGCLQITGLGSVTDVSKVEKAELKNKKQLLRLELDFDGNNEKEMDYQVLEALQPPSELESLKILDYGGTTVFTNWIMSLMKLRRIKLSTFKNCQCLPPLGKLASLESLSILNMFSVKHVGVEFWGFGTNDGNSNYKGTTKKDELPFISFPKLKRLHFGYMHEWEEWDWITSTSRGDADDEEEEEIPIIMPCLRSLSIAFCPKLKALPEHLLEKKTTTLQELEIRDCPIVEEQLQKRGISFTSW